MCSLVMNLCSRDVITIHLNGSRLTGLTCSKAPGFWMVEHQLVCMLVLKLFKIMCLEHRNNFCRSWRKHSDSYNTTCCSYGWPEEKVSIKGYCCGVCWSSTSWWCCTSVYKSWEHIEQSSWYACVSYLRYIGYFRGDSFRLAFPEIGTLRSLLPKSVNVLATATNGLHHWQAFHEVSWSCCITSQQENYQICCKTGYHLFKIFAPIWLMT